MTVLKLVLEHFDTIATIAMIVAGVIFTGKKLAWWQWANEITFLAFDAAEKKGLLEGIKGADKLAYYLSIWREAYMKKYGTEPTEKALTFAVNKATELAQKEKILRQSNPN